MKAGNSHFRVDGKVCLVTGAARGIGAKTAEVLAGAGGKVVVTDVREEQGKAVVAAIQKSGGAALFHRLDVTQEEQWLVAIESAVRTFGGLHVLVNNAGIDIVSLVENFTIDQWRKLMTINADGVFLGTKHAIRSMKPGGISGQGGSIINLSSVAGLVGYSGQGAYGAAKGAVRLLTKVAAIECGKLQYGIRVNSVHPGMIHTDMVDECFEDFQKLGLTPDLEQTMVMGEPLDVALCILYLASDASRFVTGSELVIDNGLTAA